MMNASIRNNTPKLDAAIQDELRELESELAQAFSRYSVPHSWILDTADLLERYSRLSGKKYKPKFEEDSIV